MKDNQPLIFKLNPILLAATDTKTLLYSCVCHHYGFKKIYYD